MIKRVIKILEDALIPTTGKAFKTPEGYLMAWGATVPADAATGYATGCVFHHTDGGDATALYVNEGSTTSADFNALDGA